MRTPLAATLILASSLALPAFAAETLEPGVVACINVKAATQYVQYSKTAPDFAKDLLARATCYINKDNAEVVKTGQSGDFTQYQLLTGHKVWVPTKGAASAAKAK